MNLTPDGGCASCRARTHKRGARIVEAPEFAGAARRMIAALGRRAEHDAERALPLLVELAAQVDDALTAAVVALRSGDDCPPYSWTEVGRILGITRQSAHERFSRNVATIDRGRAAAGDATLQSGGSGSPST